MRDPASAEITYSNISLWYQYFRIIYTIRNLRKFWYREGKCSLAFKTVTLLSVLQIWNIQHHFFMYWVAYETVFLRVWSSSDTLSSWSVYTVFTKWWHFSCLCSWVSDTNHTHICIKCYNYLLFFFHLLIV